MSRISDVLIEVQDNLDSGLTDQQIADKVGCPVSWVKDARDQAFHDDHVAPFECENW